jgi:hypothetical protein
MVEAEAYSQFYHTHTVDDAGKGGLAAVEDIVGVVKRLCVNEGEASGGSA